MQQFDDFPMPRPIETTISLPGLRTPRKILHITDLHACAFTEEEAAAIEEKRADYIRVRRRHFSGGRPYPPEDVLPVLMDYASKNADLALFTGDILDFPSESNLNLLADEMARAQIPCLYIAGNHDWSFADDYHTENAVALYRPRMDALSGGDYRIAVYEWDDLVICALDNDLDHLTPETAEAYFAVASKARAEGKALLLAMHIPLRVETLIEDTVKVWRQDLCIGEGAYGRKHADTMRFYHEVTEGTEFAPDAVIAGHLHFSHEDVFPNGVCQYVTTLACGGDCRMLCLVPQV